MKSKSHDQDELSTELLNSVLALTEKIDQLETAVKKQTSTAVRTDESLKNLNITIISTNKIFDQVAQGVKDLYEKVKNLEMLGKLFGGGLGPFFGGGQKK